MRSIHLSKAALEPWAILPGSMAIILEIVTRHFAGEKLDPEEIQTRIHGAKRPEERMIAEVDSTLAAAGSGSAAGSGRMVAVLPLFGTIFPRANMFTDMSGATSAEMFGKRFDQLMQDPNVGAIVLDVDSPGGQVPGIEELGAKIFDARGSKPILAVSNHTMASAAYWIGTAADEVAVSPSGEVGSIGAFAIHEDMSLALEQEGIKLSIISAGKYKTEGNPYEPLTAEARDAIQSSVSDAYDKFVQAVARNRGVKAADVRSGFGEGRMVSSSEAVKMGMADRVATLDETITRAFRLMGKAEGAKTARAEEMMVSLPSLPGDKFEITEVESNVSGQADSAVSPVSEEDVTNLRNFLEVFGPKGA